MRPGDRTSSRRAHAADAADSSGSSTNGVPSGGNHDTAPASQLPRRVVTPGARKSGSLATVHEIHKDKVQHGKKRRSTRKRHEVDVLHEIRAKPATTALPLRGRAVKRADATRRGARQAARPKEHELAGGMPNSAPARAVERLRDTGRKVLDRAHSLYEVARSFALAPITIFRVFQDLRQRET